MPAQPARRRLLVAGGALVGVTAVAVALLVIPALRSDSPSASTSPSAPSSVSVSPSNSPSPSTSASTSHAAKASVLPAPPSGTWAAWVKAENAKPGTDARIRPANGDAAGLAAYADRVSVRPGESVGLYISAAGPVHIRALRVGHYAGAGMRQVWAGDVTARLQPAVPAIQTGPISDGGGLRNTRALYARWTMTTAVDTTGWPEGDYVFRLDAGRASRYVLLTVRSADAVGRVLLVNAPITWQAYNKWGGRGLYGDESNDFGNRSYAVSFDRPYDDGYGSGRFFTYDSWVVQQAESLGLPLAWATDYDLALNPHLLDGAVAVVFGGHAEYWTGPMRDAVVAQVARGTNLAVFGANTAYWRVRLVGRNAGLVAQPDRRDGRPRIVFGAKDAGLDPLAKSDPAGATARFRDSPAPRREEDLTGMRYDCFPADADWVVSDPSWWGYAGTGLSKGSVLAGVVAPESDRAFPVPTRPHPEQVIAYSPMRCGTYRTYHTGVYWTNPAGAGVVAVGTMGWPRSMGLTGVGPAVRKITDNVLTAFAEPYAGRAHPARDTVDRYHLPSRATTNAS